MKQRVFTISPFEVLGVIVVTGVLSALLLAYLPTGYPMLSSHELSREFLRDIGVALSEYREEHNAYPPAYTTDADGTPLHSWRTLLLPHLGRKDLFETIDLRKPWDDPANAFARQQDVWPYYSRDEGMGEGMTTHLALIGPAGAFAGIDPRTTHDVAQEGTKTIVAINADISQAVHWMSPEDIDLRRPFQASERSDEDAVGYNVLYADGDVGELSAELLTKKLAAMAVDMGRSNTETADSSEADQASPEGAKP